MGNKSSKSSVKKTSIKNKNNTIVKSLNKDNSNVINKEKENLNKNTNQNKNINKKNKIKNENKNTQKTINISYDGCIQKIKYFGNFNAESIKKIAKSRFFIEESIEKIFFQDEEYDILILNENTPDNITVYLYIQKDLIPKNPTKALKILKPKKEELLKFHWVLENEDLNREFRGCIVDKYIYRNINDSVSHPQARSSVTFTKGVHFFVVRVGTFESYECLRVVEDNSPCIKKEWNYEHNTNIGFSFNIDSCHHTYGKPLDIGILIDMEKKRCSFYYYDEKKPIITGHNYYPQRIAPLTGKIKDDGVKLVAWLKRGNTSIDRGITILN
jgi:hypothetical protein